jgi:carbonic anhydrase/acetyltransferase-like protein (isoleucine patch superfamily)
LLGRYHINDLESDVNIDEDCWIGARVTILAGTHLRRGTVVGANTLLNREYPPYAVLVGSPARIVASKFSIDQIIEHEKKLYPKSERFSVEQLKTIFNTYYKDKKHIGIDHLSVSDQEIVAAHKEMQFSVE